MKQRTESRQPELVWHQEQKTMTLEGEPVLEYTLSWPELKGGGLGGKWISRYYAHLAKSWRLRWQREIYWKACLALTEQRAASRPFTPWRGALQGEVTLWEGGLLSLRLQGEEDRGDGRPCRVRWGDVWNVREGAPCPLSEFFRGQKGWKKGVTSQIKEKGRQAQQAGALFFDSDWEQRITSHIPFRDFCLTEEGIEFVLPQCAVSPAVEGTPSFSILCPGVSPFCGTAETAACQTG